MLRDVVCILLSSESIPGLESTVFIPWGFTGYVKDTFGPIEIFGVLSCTRREEDFQVKLFEFISKWSNGLGRKRNTQFSHG